MAKTLTNLTALIFVVEKLFLDQRLIFMSYNNKTIDIVDEVLLKPLPHSSRQYSIYNTDHKNIQAVLTALENHNVNDMLLVTFLDNDSDFNNDNLFKNKAYFNHLIIMHRLDIQEPISSKFMETLKGQIDNYNPILILWSEHQAIKMFSMCTRNELRPITAENIENPCDRAANFMGSTLTVSGYFHAPRMMFLKRFDTEEIGIGGKDGYFLTLLANYFNATINVHIRILKSDIDRNKDILLSPKSYPYSTRISRATWVPIYAIFYA